MFIVVKRRSELVSNKQKIKGNALTVEKSKMCVRASIGPKTMKKRISKNQVKIFFRIIAA